MTPPYPFLDLMRLREKKKTGRGVLGVSYTRTSPRRAETARYLVRRCGPEPLEDLLDIRFGWRVTHPFYQENGSEKNTLYPHKKNILYMGPSSS